MCTVYITYFKKSDTKHSRLSWETPFPPSPREKKKSDTSFLAKDQPLQGLEPWISCSVDRRLIHWAIKAVTTIGRFHHWFITYSQNGNQWKSFYHPIFNSQRNTRKHVRTQDYANCKRAAFYYLNNTFNDYYVLSILLHDLYKFYMYFFNIPREPAIDVAQVSIWSLFNIIFVQQLKQIFIYT